MPLECGLTCSAPVTVPFLEEAKTDTSEECGSVHCGMGAGDGARKLEATFLSETGT